MKKIKNYAFVSVMMLAMLSMTACGSDKAAQTDVSGNSAVATSESTTESVAEGTKAETVAPTDSAEVNTEDYSAAKSQIEEFYNSYTRSNEVIISDVNAPWIRYESYIYKTNGGRYYSDNWNLYVANEETKEYIDFDMFPTDNDKDSGLPLYDAKNRLGYGTFRVCAIYENDELGVYYFVDKVIVFDETTTENVSTSTNGTLIYHFNLSELIGEEITLKTYQLESDE